MTSVKQTYSLNNIRQLIDLNGDTTNFDISFKVVSKNGEPFDIVVVDQTTLDNSPELQYRPATNGQMSGNLIQDKNIYQNYFLVLKASQPCECDVEIIKKDLPKTPVVEQNIQPPDTKTNKKSDNTETSWKFWLIIAVIAVGAVVLYLVYRHDKKKKTAAGGDNDDDVSVGGAPAQSPAQSERSGVAPSNSPPGNDLIQRLKRLHME